MNIIFIILYSYEYMNIIFILYSYEYMNIIFIILYSYEYMNIIIILLCADLPAILRNRECTSIFMSLEVFSVLF